MPLDGYTLSLVKNELAEKIIGSRIEKVHQPAKDELVLSLRSRQGANKLLISLSSSIPHICLTENTPENPAVPPMLCMFLRKHLTGCVIESVTQQGLDRTLFMDVRGTNEIGDSVSFRLAVELMPKHANFIVISSEGNILEAVRHTDSTLTVERRIQPGFFYTLPPVQNKYDITKTEISDIISLVTNQKGKMLSSALLSVLEGASPLICREIASRVSGNDIPVDEMNDAYILRLQTFLEEIRNILLSGGVPTALIKDGKPFDFSFTDIKQYGFSAETKEYESFSILIDSFYSEKTRIERTSQQGRELSKTLSNLIARAERKLETRKQEKKNCEGKDENRIFAELILANQYALEKGSMWYDLQNFYDEYNQVRIKADPALSPAGNAQKYFKEYNKLKNAEKMLDDLIKESETEVQYLESVLDAVKRADGFSDIAEIKSELSEQGYLRKNKESKNKKVQKKLKPLEYVSDDGYLILVGRNNIQNDQLSLKESAKDDSWFHTKSCPGSHVVVVGNGDILPERTCRQAAIIAAYNSSARESSQVAVDYTEIRELKKPKGGKPGMVIYHTYNTMWVNPDRELCEKLKKH